MAPNATGCMNNRDIRPMRRFISKMIQERIMVIMKRQQELVRNL